MITFATTIEEAVQAKGEFRAGGTDVQARRRFHVSAGPMVDIGQIQGLDTIAWREDGKVVLGAFVTLDAISQERDLCGAYPGFAMAAGALATPQIRWMSTLGGSLLQRTRCAYFRHPDLQCLKKGGTYCPSREGEHRFGVCFDRGTCVFPHPSTLGMVLMAYEAQVQIHGKMPCAVADIYGDGSDSTRDHLLGPGELLSHVILPKAWEDERASYFRAIARARAEWPLVEAIVRLQLDAQEIIQQARVAIGGVATVPLRLPLVEQALIGKSANDANFAQAARLSTEGARPLPQTAYKVGLVEATVMETMQRAYQRVWGGEG